MSWPQFRAAGLCTSTGVVEAGCKVAIGTRCKRAGMHWTVAGVDAIIALRGCKLRTSPSPRGRDTEPSSCAAITEATGDLIDVQERLYR